MHLKQNSLFIAFYIIITIVQFMAGLCGLMHMFDLHWIFAGFAAGFLILMPAFGPMAGVYGATVVWNWPALIALFLFFWQYFIYAGLFLFGATKALLFWKKMISPIYFSSAFKKPQKDIEPEFSVKESPSENKESSERLIIEYKNDLDA